MQDFDLTASVASRICHDLVSPVGAIVNGIDLVRETGGADWTEAVGMIGHSAVRASSLLQFYRIAFGAADPDSPAVSRGVLSEHAAVLEQPPRVTLEWEGRNGTAIPRTHAQLIALLLLCARSVTGMRGTIGLHTGVQSCIPLTLTVEGDGFSATLGMLDLLEGAPPPRPLSPRAVEFVLAARAVEPLGLRLSVERGDGRISIAAHQTR